MSVHERCWLCMFWNGERCTQTFRLIIHMEPREGLGGQVDFSCTPGMVPEELKPRLTEYISKFLTKALPAISMLPIWDEIRDFQLANLPERADCPARKENEALKPHLKLVKF